MNYRIDDISRLSEFKIELDIALDDSNANSREEDLVTWFERMLREMIRS